MGLFRTTDSYIGRAMPLTAALVGAPNALPGWVFENQTGVLGTYLNSSVLYVGVSGDISVILPGTSLNSVSTLSLLSGGTGYTNGAQVNIPTLCSSSLASGLTINATVVGNAITVPTIGNSAGSGYNVGDIVNINGAGGTNATVTITAVNKGVPISAQAIVFKAVPAGTILPVAVDYITAIGALAVADIIIGR
tara:strand:- start:53 stop:631 length:579 start_codon:yes stop_codon:yes gene_type:complete